MRPMDQDMIATHLKKLDRRLAKVEQILPGLATKDEVLTAIAPLATKDDLKALAAETKEDLVELRRHMDVLTESLRGDIHLIAAHVASERSKHPGT
jgi:hypothetical protein